MMTRDSHQVTLSHNVFQACLPLPCENALRTPEALPHPELSRFVILVEAMEACRAVEVTTLNQQYRSVLSPLIS